MELLEPSAFANDIEVSIRFQDAEAAISERLMQRLVLVGRAYGLHRLPLLGEDVELNALQSSSLASELEFIRSLVPADRALGLAASTLSQLAERSARSSTGHLSIEWP